MQSWPVSPEKYTNTILGTPLRIGNEELGLSIGAGEPLKVNMLLSLSSTIRKSNKSFP